MTEMLFEIWDPVPDENFAKYEVSTEGRVRNTNTGYILSPWEDLNNRGVPYLRVDLYGSDGRRWKPYVHRLVLMTFRPIDDPDFYHGDHKNTDTLDCRLENLQWETPEYHAELTRIRNGAPELEEAPF